ncbi:MAG: AAA family ATPase, partial [Candidatus Cloacimonadaceae bacterium]|nr:AAA family ATPase [Candidatus Cloacimonadaceae bacterium]
MFLESIRLQNFRNYLCRSFSFEPLGSLIVGPNGSGKTNLLEAIAYTGIGKSIRFHHDEQLLHFDNNFFNLKAVFEQDLGLGL